MLVTCAFCLNIQYLFVCLFKLMETKAGGTDDLYLLMQICCSNMCFLYEYSISICLLIQIYVNKNINRPPAFIYLCKLVVATCAFRLNIQYVFVYFFKSMSTKAGGNYHLLLFTYANCLLWYVFRLNIYYY